jgi:hypothetical protein
MFAPNCVDGGINSIVSQSCRSERLSGEQKEILWGGWIIPKTPAELPKNVPLRVTELRMLLIRSRVFDTASGLPAPSRKPHAPPRARPGKRFRACGQHKDNKMADKVKFGQVRLDAKRIVECSIDREKHRMTYHQDTWYLCRSRGRHSSLSKVLRCLNRVGRLSCHHLTLGNRAGLLNSPWDEAWQGRKNRRVSPRL